MEDPKNIFHLNDSNNHGFHDIKFYDRTIRTLLTNSDFHTTCWIEAFGHNPLHVGLDIEWGPDSHNSHNSRTAIIQLCVDAQCLIYQFFPSSSPAPLALKNFLADSRNTFYGAGIDEDVKKLKKDYDLVVSNTKDLNDMAIMKMPHLKPPNDQKLGLKTLARVVLDWNLEKSDSLTQSQWDRPLLSLVQIKYATLDAFVAVEIAKSLMR